MPDREKVITTLHEMAGAFQICADQQQDLEAKRVFQSWANCVIGALSLIFTLIGPPETAYKTFSETHNGVKTIFCRNCRAMLAQEKPKGFRFCPWCGKGVIWDD